MSFKNAIIFGDSYSTFAGYIPDGYAVYYHSNGGNTDVRSVTETWWHSLFAETDTHLVQNNSWSGSTICYTGYGGDCSGDSSFIYRLNKLNNDGFFKENELNTVFVFGGTNDSWANAPVGELQFNDWDKNDLFSVLPAVCYFINRIKEVLPKADIVWLINTELKPKITDGMKKACEFYNVKYIEFKSIDKCCGHPTVKGMQDIKNEILKSLK